MADFCRQCTVEFFGEEYADKNDMIYDIPEDIVCSVLCEDCGFIWVDSKGSCTGCPKHPIYGPFTLEEEMVIIAYDMSTPYGYL